MQLADDEHTEEADKVSSRIAEILSENAFSFSTNVYINTSQTFSGNIQICRTDKRLQCYKKEWVLDGATVQKGIHETTE